MKLDSFTVNLKLNVHWITWDRKVWCRRRKRREHGVEFRAPFTWDMKSSEGFELEVPGDEYSASKFVGDDEAAYISVLRFFHTGLRSRSFACLTSAELGGDGRYTSALRAADMVLASAFTIGGRFRVWLHLCETGQQIIVYLPPCQPVTSVWGCTWDKRRRWR